MRRKNATDISDKVRRIVKERDERCILCGARGEQIAHVVNRSQGGKGVPENLVYLCHTCHHNMDNGNDPVYSYALRRFCEEYLKEIYPEWTRESVTYSKWKGVFG